MSLDSLGTIALQLLSDHLGIATFALFAVLIGWQIHRKNKHHAKAEALLDQAVQKKADEPLTLHPEIDPSLCAGCGSCVSACPEGKILQLIDHKAVLVSPTKCVGHGECERACPLNAISLVFGTKTRGMDIPRITSDYETNVPGLYIAGELGGMGLIRNAIKQGVHAANHAIDAVSKDSSKTDTDLLIIGAGPAGLAAALAATQKKVKYICIEQNSFGGTVFNFPRQKVVMSQPAEVPIFGVMKFKGNKVTKEELLERWSQIRKDAKLNIQENTRFTELKRDGAHFIVGTSQGPIRAKKVILALGVRGSPRKLGLPNEDSEKVAYNLVDPEQYQGKNIAVVGGGNAAVEAAQYLCRAQYGNKVTLLVRGETMDRCNDENLRLIHECETEGRVKILYQSSVKSIEPTKIQIQTKDQESTIANDYLFVFAGAEMPHKFLMSLGIEIDKKFGEALSKRSA